MTYELAKQLYDAEFPGEIILQTDGEDIWQVEKFPNLSELIEACGLEFDSLEFLRDESQLFWRASGGGEPLEPDYEDGMTPEEAVAKLWLALNTKT